MKRKVDDVVYPKLVSISLSKRKTKDYGYCNGHTERPVKYRTIIVIEFRGLELRLCRSCAKDLKAMLRKVK